MEMGGTRGREYPGRGIRREWHQSAVKGIASGFDDFIAAAEWLIAQVYHDPQTRSSGGSNGDLVAHV
jgi:prolyl oligopeptidase PreP (S9A serine peptidase family)